MAKETLSLSWDCRICGFEHEAAQIEASTEEKGRGKERDQDPGGTV